MDTVQPLLDWIAQHAAWGYLILFLTAFVESLVLVGLFLPGAVMLFGFGTLVGMHVLELAPTLALVFIGSAAGDLLSFYLGRRFHAHLFEFKLFQKYKNWIHKTHLFLKKHGAKSVLIGRFFGPIRATLPTVAGMLDMSAPRFIVSDLVSITLWVPFYILPGALFGASLQTLSKLGSRLMVLAALGVAATLVLTWLAYHLWQNGKRWMTHLGKQNFAALSHAPGAGVLFVVGLLLLLFTLSELLLHGWLVSVSQTLCAFLQAHRYGLLDEVAVIVTQLGDDKVLLSVAVFLMLGLLASKQFKIAFCVGGSLVTVVLVSTLLKYGLRIPRPSLESVGTAYSFPSGHVAHGTVVWGYLAILLAETFSSRAIRIWIYTKTTIVLFLIAASRLYLGAHWLFDVLGGFGLGISVLTAFVLLQYHLEPNHSLSWPARTKILIISLIVSILLGYQLLTHNRTLTQYQQLKIDPYRLENMHKVTRYNTPSP